jgi:hypothetical protein
LEISILGFVLHRCQLKAIRAFIVISGRTVFSDAGELKRMDWILVSSAESTFDLSENVPVG